MYTGVDHRFHEQEDVGRASSAERRRHVKVVLVVDEDLLPERRQDGPALLALLLWYLSRRRPDCDALSNPRWRVRHGADHVRVVQPLAKLLNVRTRDDAQYDLRNPPVEMKFLQHL